MLRPDFFDLVTYAVERRVGVKFSTNGTRMTPVRARRLAALDYLDVQISLDGAVAATNDAVRGAGSLRRGAVGHGRPRRGRIRPVQDQRGGDAPQHGRARRARRARGRLRRPTPAHPAAPVGPRRRHLGCAAPDQRAAAHALPLVVRAPRGPHRGLLLPPVRARRTARRTEPVRRRTRGLPHRPGGRRVRLPVRDRSPVPGRQRARPRWLRRGVARLRAVRGAPAPPSAGACASCGSYDACRGGCMAAKFFTGLPLDGPDPECVHGHGETALASRSETNRPGPSWATPGCTPTARRCRCRCRCAARVPARA